MNMYFICHVIHVNICFIVELFAKEEECGRVHTKLFTWITLDGRKFRGREQEPSNMRKRKIAQKHVQNSTYAF